MDLARRTGIAFNESSDPSPGTLDLSTADSAIRLGFLHNPQTRALLAEADLARAERGEGRALPNPEADFAFRKNGGESHWELSVLGDVNGLLLYPWKRGAANTRYRATLNRLAAHLSEQKTQVYNAYFSAIAATQIQAFVANTAATWEAAAELSRRQRQAGTLNALDLAETEAAATEARLALRSAEGKASEERENLARVLGLPSSAWSLPDSLPDPLPEDPALGELEALAKGRNPGLTAAREESHAADQLRALASLEAFPSLKAGISVERDEAGRNFMGPAVSAEIPLFDLGFARRARSRAEGELARRRLTALESRLYPEIRARHQALGVARRNHEEVRKTLIPLRETATAEALKQYNFMLTGVYRLLAARREELSARILGMESLRDYWIARGELERLVGGPLPQPASGDKP
jgi:cobalt-zinc-cadmium efflux system outer membrane protein